MKPKQRMWSPTKNKPSVDIIVFTKHSNFHMRRKIVLHAKCEYVLLSSFKMDNMKVQTENCFEMQ